MSHFAPGGVPMIDVQVWSANDHEFTVATNQADAYYISSLHNVPKPQVSDAGDAKG